MDGGGRGVRKQGGGGGREGGMGRGFVRSKLQKANAGEERGCRGERITELNVWAD